METADFAPARWQPAADADYPTMPIPRPLLLVLIVLNAVVLLGQLWPEGAPPFARAVNILFLLLNVGVFCILLTRLTAK